MTPNAAMIPVNLYFNVPNSAVYWVYNNCGLGIGIGMGLVLGCVRKVASEQLR